MQQFFVLGIVSCFLSLPVVAGEIVLPPGSSTVVQQAPTIVTCSGAGNYRQTYCLCDQYDGTVYSYAKLNVYSMATHKVIHSAESFSSGKDSYYGTIYLDRCYARMQDLPICQ